MKVFVYGNFKTHRIKIVYFQCFQGLSALDIKMKMRSKKLYHNAINDITLSLISTVLMSDMVTVNIITHLFLHHPTSNPVHRSTNSLGMKRAFLHLVFLLLELHHFNTFLLFPSCYLPALQLWKLFFHFLHPNFASHHFLPL